MVASHVRIRARGTAEARQGSYDSCGTSKQSLFMSPWETQPLPSSQRATETQVRRVFGGVGRRSEETGISRPSAVYGAPRFMKRSTHARVTPVFAQDFAASVNHIAAA